MPRANRGPHLWEDPDTGIWQVRDYVAGKRTLSSTGSRDRAQAEAHLAHVILELQRPALPPEPSVGDVLKAYAAARTETHGYRQLESKCRVVAGVIGWLKPSEVKAAHIRDYIARRKVATRPGKGGAMLPIAQGTIREELAKLRAALRWADSEGLIPTPRPIRIPISGKPRTRWLTGEEVDQLLAATIEPHVRTYLTIALHTAARSSAILELPWSGVDFERGIVVFPQKEGGKNREAVPINETLNAELCLAWQRRTTEWVIEYAGQRVRSMRTGWQATLARSKIEHCTRHDLRRTAGSLMLQDGVKLELVSAVLGHRDTAITRRIYAHLTVEHLRPAVAALDKKRSVAPPTLTTVPKPVEPVNPAPDKARKHGIG